MNGTPARARSKVWLEAAIVVVAAAAVLSGVLVRGDHAPERDRTPMVTVASPRHVTTLQDLKPVAGEPLFSLDAVIVNGKLFAPASLQLTKPLRATDSVIVTGWAADRAAGAPADGVFLSVGSARPSALQYGNSRPDVAAALGNPSLERTGFSGHVLLRALHAATIPLRFYVVNSAGTAYFEVPPPISLTVR